MRLNQVPEVFGTAIDVVGGERIIGETYMSDITYSVRGSGAPIDVTSYGVTHNIKAFTADGETVQSLTNFAEMSPQPGELSQVQASVVNGPGGHIQLRVPKTIFLSSQPEVNAIREIPVLAVWVYVDNQAGRTRCYRYLLLYRNGGD